MFYQLLSKKTTFVFFSIVKSYVHFPMCHVSYVHNDIKIVVFSKHSAFSSKISFFNFCIELLGLIHSVL